MTNKRLGFERTTCDCRVCQINCEYIPGFLTAEDIPRIMNALGYTDEKLFAREHLRASPGAIVKRQGKTFRVPYLVPVRKKGGACHWLTAGGQCAIHEVSPTGCAIFDGHMEPEYEKLVSQTAIFACEREFNTWWNSQYWRLWKYLKSEKLMAPDGVKWRRLMSDQLKREGLK